MQKMSQQYDQYKWHYDNAPKYDDQQDFETNMITITVESTRLMNKYLWTNSRFSN